MKKADLKRSAKVQSLLGKPVPPKMVVVIEKPTRPVTKLNPVALCTLTLKYAKKMQFKAITTYMPGKKIPVTGECKNPTEAFNENYCLSYIHHGVNKCISNEAILEGYAHAVHGMKAWQKFSDSLSSSSESCHLKLLLTKTIYPPWRKLYLMHTIQQVRCMM